VINDDKVVFLKFWDKFAHIAPAKHMNSFFRGYALKLCRFIGEDVLRVGASGEGALECVDESLQQLVRRHTIHTNGSCVTGVGFKLEISQWRGRSKKRRHGYSVVFTETQIQTILVCFA
jgi:hypothetical protein